MTKPVVDLSKGSATIDQRDVGGQEILYVPPDALEKRIQVVVTIPDYGKNHAEAIGRGEVPTDEPAPTVAVHQQVALHCGACGQDFLVTFAEVQRLLPCPQCGREVWIPEQYRGMP